MSYTDQDVEEVINAYFVSYDTSKNARGQTADASTVHCKAHEQGVRAARAALEAMAREPLENVLRDTRSWLQHLEVALQDDGQFACTVYGCEVTGTDSPVMDATRYGADPADAIRNAINAAQEER